MKKVEIEGVSYLQVEAREHIFIDGKKAIAGQLYIDGVGSSSLADSEELESVPILDPTPLNTKEVL